jgi:hypothetical protein
MKEDRTITAPQQFVRYWIKADKGGFRHVPVCPLMRRGHAQLRRALKRLIGGSVEIADRFQLHSMTMENGIAKMRHRYLTSALAARPAVLSLARTRPKPLPFSTMNHSARDAQPPNVYILSHTS